MSGLFGTVSSFMSNVPKFDVGIKTVNDAPKISYLMFVGYFVIFLWSEKRQSINQTYAGNYENVSL